ncbi:Y-family DNA polymerase, partial [Streptococcus pyogenes]
TTRYSIDESFLSLAGMTHLVDFEQYGREIRATLQHNLSLTCGIGAAKTKTLAKLATYASKRWKATGGVVVLTDPARVLKLLSLVETGDIW